MTPVVGVGPHKVIPGSGGFGHEQPITLSRVVSASDPLRVGFIGDSLMYYAYGGIRAALNSTGDTETGAMSYPGFGLVDQESPAGFVTTASPSEIASRMRELATFRTSFHPDVVVGTWTWDNAFAAQHPAAYENLLEEAVTTLTEGPGAAKGVIFVPFPTPGPNPPHPSDVEAALFNPRAEAAWDKAITNVEARMPGKVMVIPADDSVLLNHRFAKWLPPGNRPDAPYPQWVQVRMPDNVHLCQNGVVRLASALVADLQSLFGINPPTEKWVNGAWSREPIYSVGLGTFDRCATPHPPQ